MLLIVQTEVNLWHNVTETAMAADIPNTLLLSSNHGYWVACVCVCVCVYTFSN